MVSEMGLEKLGNLMGLFLVDEVAEGRKHDANNRYTKPVNKLKLAHSV